MANSLEMGFTPVDTSLEITKAPETPLPLAGEIFEGKAVDINFMQFGDDYFSKEPLPTNDPLLHDKQIL